MHNSIRLCASLAFIAAMAFPAYAKTCTWAGGSGSWDTAANWQGGEKPENGDTVVISNDTASAAIVNDIEGLTLASFTEGGTATLSSPNITVQYTDEYQKSASFSFSLQWKNK